MNKKLCWTTPAQTTTSSFLQHISFNLALKQKPECDNLVWKLMNVFFPAERHQLFRRQNSRQLCLLPQFKNENWVLPFPLVAEQVIGVVIIFVDKSSTTIHKWSDNLNERSVKSQVCYISAQALENFVPFATIAQLVSIFLIIYQSTTYFYHLRNAFI